MTKPTYDDLLNTLNALQRDTLEVYHALKRGETPLLGIGQWQRAWKAEAMCTPDDIRAEPFPPMKGQKL